MSDMPKELRAALLEVWEKTQKNGNEHLVVLRKDSMEVAGREDGDWCSVRFPEDLRDKPGPWIIVHSHPGPDGFSLSLQDLCCAAQVGCSSIFAITDDKMVYGARPLVKDPDVLWWKGMALSCGFGGEFQHENNLKLEKLGLIKYEFGKLPEEE